MRHKYNAVKVKEDGYTFDSKQEHKRYCELRLLERAKQIGNLEVHPRFDIEINGSKICTYEADFGYRLLHGAFFGKARVIEDVKAIATPVYRIKKKLMKAVHGIDITEINVLKRNKRDDNAKIEENSIRRKNSATGRNKPRRNR
jgi:hypothetical protein